MGAGTGRSAVSVLLAGLVAGSVATLAQLLLWWLAGEDAWALLLRDARLTAALVLGKGVLPPPADFDAAIMLAATVVHFALSLLYAALLLPARRLRAIPALLAGAGFGALLYAVNLHGFTALFPWFAQARGGVTLAAHVAFGVTVMLGYRCLAAGRDKGGAAARCRPGAR